MGNSINDILMEDFQNVVSELLIRNRSILDVLTKMQTSEARVSRAVIKSVTHCGCVQIDGRKQTFPDEASMSELSGLVSTQLIGELCPDCRQTIEKEIGGALFYLVALCNTLGISLYDVIVGEKETLDTLGNYNLR